MFANSFPQDFASTRVNSSGERRYHDKPNTQLYIRTERERPREKERERERERVAVVKVIGCRRAYTGRQTILHPSKVFQSAILRFMDNRI